MSDFSELCPIFNTGVFNEVLFPNIEMIGITATGNALLGTITCGSATRTDIWTFGRTVVVTGGFIRKRINPTIAATVVLRLRHHTTMEAIGTEFATLAISISVTCMQDGYSWVPFNTVTDTTFTSDEVLGFTVLTGTASGLDTFDLIVRYKEK